METSESKLAKECAEALVDEPVVFRVDAENALRIHVDEAGIVHVNGGNDRLVVYPSAGNSVKLGTVNGPKP